MKKSIIITSLIATASLIGTATYAITSQNAESTSTNQGAIIATTALGTNDLKVTDTSDETVYLIADANGAVSQTFIGSSLYNGTATAPVELKVTYFLNGEAISAQDLVGKSGRVRIEYRYESHATYQGKNVPFVALTGLTLDSAKFTNITVANGKIVSQGSNLALAGYSLVGLNQNFGTDLLPDIFSIEADVTDFTLGTTYTVFVNDLFADLDTSRLTTVDNAINSINELSNGLDQIIAGTSDLSNGLKSALDGTATLVAGAKDLKTGTATALEGVATLATGLATLTENNEALIGGATQVFNTFLGQVNAQIASTGLATIMEQYNIPTTLTIENYQEVITTTTTALDAKVAELATTLANVQDATARATINANIAALTAGSTTLTSAKTQLDSYNTFYTGLTAYADGVATASAGADALATGLSALDTGAGQLSAGLGTLLTGTETIYNGSVTLKDGLNTFKTTGINKLVDLANNDLASFAYNARKTTDAARSYTHFASPSAKSVKFILKTASIK